MILIRKHAYARTALVGNPSDGYGGRTISLIVPHFRASVALYEWDDLEIIWAPQDRSRFRSLREFVTEVDRHGYYGGVPLVKATIKRFADYCRNKGHVLHNRNFSIRYESDIPRQVGLAGSSAIVVATLRALLDFYDLEQAVPQELLPSIALSVETEELGLPAGLQDRVVQVYGGLVYMDFTPDRTREIDGYICGSYEPLDPSLLPPLFLAYRPEAGKPSQIRLPRDDPQVQAGMRELAEITEQARSAILAGDHEELGRLMNATFDVRERLYDLRPDHHAMIHAARNAGACVNFSGSGGAIVGIRLGGEADRRLREALAAIGCRVVGIDPSHCTPEAMAERAESG